MVSEFHYNDQQRLFCEQVDLADLQETLCVCEDRPFIMYSKAQIVKNAEGYLNGWKEGIKFKIGYALKANFNPAILRIFRDMGLGCIAVSGNEVNLALREGIPPDSIILNGNGKQRWERALALKNGCFLNIDSSLDAKSTSDLTAELGVTAKVFVRVNSESEVCSDVHSYNQTASSGSKFGVGLLHLEEVLEIIGASSSMELIGLHCHLGSTIKDVSVLVNNLRFLTALGNKLREKHRQLKILNLGGGLGIDYLKTTSVPVAKDLIHVINQEPDFESWEYILEPGRSLIGNAGMIIGRIIGVKEGLGENKRFIVTNVGMNDLIRPCLYEAYHHISLLDKTDTAAECEEAHHLEKTSVFDVVGPICESGDFLAKNYEIVEPKQGAGFAVWDVGAYGACMGSNYNMRPKLAEILVDGNTWSLIRRAESFEDILRTYDELRSPAVETSL